MVGLLRDCWRERGTAVVAGWNTVGYYVAYLVSQVGRCHVRTFGKFVGVVVFGEFVVGKCLHMGVSLITENRFISSVLQIFSGYGCILVEPSQSLDGPQGYALLNGLCLLH